MKYLALLRGINVGGNNIIPMKHLIQTFESLTFTSVKTYIQSGNVIFESPKTDPRKLELKIERALTKEYDYPATVVVKSKAEMAKIIKSIPETWTKETEYRYNILFLRHTADSKKILKELSPKEEIEEVSYGPGALYWSAAIKTLTKSSMIKFASHARYKEVTIRNLNTTRKLGALIAEK